MIKICGIRDAEAAVAAIEAGATALGFVFAPSPRRVTPETARAICHRMPDAIECIGVFRGMLLDEMRAVAAQVPLHALQIHVDPELELPVTLDGLEVIAAGSLEQVATLPHRRVLVDSPAGAGSGQAWDYSRARKLCEKRPVILAGGLRVANVAAAIAAARPAGVDVSSGVDLEPGTKDPGMILAFCTAALTALNEISETRP
ncbi:MAG: phosphoribosylanthranilate isomerase [Planctomycetes bacterium]|nr:phosphoribosylanthranilate isomerase [Planctomycetota bacterium]